MKASSVSANYIHFFLHSVLLATMAICLSMSFAFKYDDFGHSFMFASFFIETKHCLGYVCFMVYKHVTFTKSNSFL